MKTELAALMSKLLKATHFHAKVFENYSGKTMLGSTTTAVITDADASEVLAVILANVRIIEEESNSDQNLAKVLKRPLAIKNDQKDNEYVFY